MKMKNKNEQLIYKSDICDAENLVQMTQLSMCSRELISLLLLLLLLLRVLLMLLWWWW